MMIKAGLNQKKRRGASLAEFVIVIPVVLILALLCLQMLLMYRAKLAHNFAVQEAARIGAMSNGRVVPRFLTDPLTAWFGNKAYGAVAKLVCKPALIGGPFCTAEVDEAANRPGVRQATAASDGVPVDNNVGSSNGNSDEAANLPGGTSGFWASLKTSPATQKAVTFVKALMRYGDSSVLQGYINGITPMYMGKHTGATAVIGAQWDAYMDALPNSCILYHNPTQAAFIESGNIELQGLDYGILKLPADYMRFRTPLDPAAVDAKNEAGYNLYANDKFKGELTGKTIQENTILSIEVLWSYPLKVPIANSIIIGLTRLFNTGSQSSAMVSAFQAKALERGRYPFSSSASYRAQNALHWHPFYPLGAKSPPGGGSGYEAFDLIALLWNAGVDAANFDPAEPQIGFCLGAFDLDGSAQENKVSDHWWGEKQDRAAAQSGPPAGMGK